MGMKYCAKCGNPMADDMLFCQKCGTKFEWNFPDIGNTIQGKLDKMKKYNLVIDSKSISWNYLHEDGTRAGQLTLKQDKLCHELTDLVKDILDTVTEEDRDIVEREVYSYILQMGSAMCTEGEKLFEDYSGLREFYDAGTSLVQMGKLNMYTFISQLDNQDRMYRSIAGLQGLHSARIKETLNEEVIYNNLEYKNLTLQLAQSFNNMFLKCVKRFSDFRLTPGDDFLDQHWEIYNTILKGLPLSMIDTLNKQAWEFAYDTHGWEHVLYNSETIHMIEQRKLSFLKKRNIRRNELQAKEQQEQKNADKKYWESHPEEFAKVQEKQECTSELIKKIQSLTQEKVSAEAEVYRFHNKIDDIQNKIDEKQSLIENLKKKIFGKKKAQEEIEQLNLELEQLKKELQEANDTIHFYEKLMSDTNKEINTLEEQTRSIGREIKELRSK